MAGIRIDCARSGCVEQADVMREGGDWSPGRAFMGQATIEVVLPEGWAIDLNGVDHVIHCPVHAGDSAS